MHKAANAVHKAREPVRSRERKRSVSRRGAACVCIAGADGSSGCALARAVARAGSCVCAAACTREGSWMLEVLMHDSSGEFGSPGMVSGTVAAARVEHLGGRR